MKTALKATAAIAALMSLGACGIFNGRDKGTPVVGERMPILTSDAELAVDPSIASLPVTAPAAQVNSDWSQPGGNAAKSMGHLALGASVTRAWTTSIPGSSLRARLASSPVIGGGRLYVVDVNGVVHALDAATGAQVWRANTVEGNANEGSRFGGGVSYDNGRVYATNGLGDVVAYDAGTGGIAGRATPSGPLRGAPTVANGQVYVESQDNQLFALNQADGSVAWTAAASPEAQGVFGVAAPAAARGTVVAGFSSGELNAYRYENGNALWADALSRTSISTSVSALSDIDAEPVIDNDRVYAVGLGGRTVALDLLTGRRLWEQNLSGISTPWIAGDWMFVVTDDARALALSRDSGRVRWANQLPRWRNVKRSTGAISWVGPVLAGDRLVAVNSEGQLVFISPADGSVLQTIEGRQPFSLPPVVANNTLYVIDDAGTISAYR